MTAPVKIREGRYRVGATYNTAFTDASSGHWDVSNTAVTKIRSTAFDASGLEFGSEPDSTLDGQLWRHRPNIPTIKGGSFNFSMYLEGAESDVTANPVATILSNIMGGIANPTTNRVDITDVSGTHTATRVYASGVDGFTQVGQAVLVGGGSDDTSTVGEARVISAEGTDFVDFSTDLSFTPLDGDELAYSTTCFFHDTTMKYFDWYWQGRDATDHLQMIGCNGEFSFENLGASEVPMLSFTQTVAGDWQEVPSGERDVLTPATAVEGNDPAIDRGTGQAIISDQSGTTRVAFKISEVTINPGVAFEAIPAIGNVNGRCGLQRIPEAPTLELTILLDGAADPLPGFYDAFNNGTAKEVYLQWGHSAVGNSGKGAVLIDFQQFYFDGPPIRTEAGGLAAITISGHGGTPAADMTTEATALANSPMRIHFF